MNVTPKGMRDFLPEDMVLREKLIGTIKDVYKKYGFQPMETPAMETLDTLKAKAGDEVEKQIFIVEDDMGMRFDLTVPLARVVANTSFPRPFKRYQISRAWRKEEPQKGRFREFWQADADIIGTKGMRAEAELLTMAKEVLDMLGFKKPVILINNRKILETLVVKLGIDDKKVEVFRLLDKIDKIGEEEVKKQLSDVIGKNKVKELFSSIEIKGNNKKKIEAAKKIDEEGAKELEEILELCNATVDLALVRGLGYYTGPVFEIKLSKEIGSVAAGGRYDGLLAIYGQGDSATGISFGIDRLVTLMKKGESEPFAKVFVACVKPNIYKDAVKIAEKFRKGGIPTEVDLNERNLKKQFDYANALNIPYMAIVGERELKQKKINLRDMETGKEKLVSVEEAIKMV